MNEVKVTLTDDEHTWLEEAISSGRAENKEQALRFGFYLWLQRWQEIDAGMRPDSPSAELQGTAPPTSQEPNHGPPPGRPRGG